MASSTHTNSTPTCHLLDIIPPEIRNKVYELVFNHHPDSIEPLQAQPPTKALLLTCHQVRAEARLVQRAAYRAYWSTTRFTIHIVEDTEENKAIVAALSDDSMTSDEEVYGHGRIHILADGDVSHISTLRLRNERSYATFALDLLENGVWAVLDEDGEHVGFNRLLAPPKHAKALQDAGIVFDLMLRPSPYIEVVVKGLTSLYTDIRMTDAEIAAVKRLTGDRGLTKWEILAAIGAAADLGMSKLLGEE